MTNTTKVVEFIIEYDQTCRLRERFTKSRRVISEFTVQLESTVGGKWVAIRRYDTAHGFVHCDIIHANGRTEKQPIPAVNFNEALSIAEHDLRSLWWFYRDEFMKEVKNYENK